MCGAASRRGHARGLGRGRGPQLFTGAHLYGGQSAACIWLAGIPVGDADVRDALVVAGAAPDHSALRAAGGDLSLPENFSLLVGIESVQHAGLLADHEHALAVAERAQDSGIAEIGIFAGVFGAVGSISALAAEVECITGRQLLRP